MKGKSILGIIISTLSILLTVAAILTLASLPQFLDYDQYALWIYEHDQENEIVLGVNNTVREASHTIDAYQLRVVSIHVDGGPASITLSVSGSQILDYPSVADEILNGTIYPPGDYDRYPEIHSFEIEVQGTGPTANISVSYTIGIITEMHYDVWEQTPTDAYYEVLS